MNDQPQHNLYLHFQELPISRRVLYTAVLLVLGMGYLFGLLYLYASDSGRDGEPGLSVQDIIVSYSGTSDGTVLEAALLGSMGTMLGDIDKESIVTWVKEGADRRVYQNRIGPIIDKNCLACHDGSNPHLPNLDGYDNMLHVVEHDTGTDVFTLVRVSHIHLFGLTFIFFLVGLVFSHALVRPVWFKCVVMATPFVCIMTDVSSWYFTKLYTGFAYVVMFSGAFMALSFAVMWFVSFWQLWFYKPPTWLQQRITNSRQMIG